jgi:hypothetical protein
MQAQLSGQVTIGNITYQASDLGSLTGLVDFDSVAPYLGIGWGNAVSADKKWGFTADLGVVFQGSPNIDLNATLGSTAAANGVTQAQLDAEVAREEANLTDDLDDFDVYPVIAFGASYRFK